jgi:hypothetical protein
VKLHKVSKEMAKKGKKVALRKAKKYNLLFFKTSKSIHKINLIGLIISLKNKRIWFLHATTSKGIIISSLSQNTGEKRL